MEDYKRFYGGCMPGELLIFNSEKDRIQKLAGKYGTFVPAAISLAAWPLPILEENISKIEALEKRIEALEKRI